MAKNIERIGDHATNIAEDLYYLVHGTPLTQKRPKGDNSSLEVVNRRADRRVTKPLVLIVEDEAPLVTLLRYNLEKEGFEVSEAGDGEEALMRIAERKPDIVLLDWMLPLVSGIEVCRQIRRSPQTRTLPVDHADRARRRGRPGARARQRRRRLHRQAVQPARAGRAAARGDAPRPAERRRGDIAVWRGRRWISPRIASRASDKPIHLGPTEFRLLRHLMQHPGRVFSREQLLDAVWGHDVYVEARTVDVHIRRLRKALNADGGADLVRTVRSAGYALDLAAR